jgi:Holliday junction resolvase RusA-like endonuclease
LMHVFRPVPESWSRRDHELALVGGIRPTSKPDDDNYLKIRDALNGIVWNDDAQCVDSRVLKFYSKRPALRIEIRELISPRY